MPNIAAIGGHVIAGFGADRVNLDYPPNDASHVLFAVVAVHYSSPPTINTPSGWTLITTATIESVDSIVGLFWRAGGVSGSVAFTFGTSSVWSQGVMVVLSDCDNASHDGPSSTSNTGTTTHTGSSITASVVNELLLGVWVGALTPLSFTPTAMQTQFSVAGQGSTPPYNLPLLIASESWAASGATGSRVARTPFNETSRVLLLGFKPYPGPSLPTVVFPNGGESLTAGATVTVNCTAATHPTVAQSALQYEYSYSTNNGGSWTVIGLSAAGVTTKAWTVPAVIGNGNLIRVRAFDGTLYSSLYDQSNATFSIVTETAPAAPVISSPAAGSVETKSAALPIAWVHQGGAGNPQTKYTLKWSRDNFASHEESSGLITSTAQTGNIDVSGEADGATISVKVQTRGVTLDSPYSAVTSFIVASAPATPVITAPTAGSPPTIPNPTITFTSASEFVAREMRAEVAGVEVHNPGEVSGSATSFVSAYSFANGVAVTFFLSVKNSAGLWSAEDSETVIAAYTGPTQPTVIYTEAPESGYVSIQITNADGDYNEIHRRLSGTAKGTAERISPALPLNATYADNSLESDEEYVYFVRTVASNGLFTDSDDSAAQSIALENLFLHAVSRTNTSSNVLGTAASLLNLIGGGHGYKDTTVSVQLLGREAPGSISGEAVWQTLSVTTFIVLANESALNNLFAIWRAQKPPTRAVLLVRDNLGNRFFCKMSSPRVVADVNQYIVSFELEETDYSEAI